MPVKPCSECHKALTTKPRFATRPTRGAKTWLSQVKRAAMTLGYPLLPWQTGGARLITELRPDGLPRFKTVIISVPRQSGKTVLSKAAIAAKAEQAPHQEIYGTAQTRGYAAKHVVALGEAIGGSATVRRGVGAESVQWPNGTFYRPISPTEGGGHGDSVDWLLADEMWTVTPQLLGGVRPAMIARPMSQLLGISTMGTLESSSWNGFVAQGRDAVDDPDATLGYIEYSAPSDEAIYGPETDWHQWMPALGRTISHEGIRTAIKDLEAAEGQSEVIRAFGNRTTARKSMLFPADWVTRATRVIEPPQRFVLALDINDEPAGAALATGHVTDEGGVATRSVEWRYGSARWILDEIQKQIAHRKVEAVVADWGGPAKVVQPEVEALCEAAYVPVVDRKPRELAADTLRFFDGLREGTWALQGASSLFEAIEGAARKALGDVWLISRRQMTVDASPLISTILAGGLAAELDVSPVVGFAIH